MSEQNPFPPFLKDGETLLWVGRPNAVYWRRAERRGVWIILACALAVLCGFAAVDALLNGSISLYYGFPLYVLGAWAVGLKFSPIRRDSPQVIYCAVTNQRVLQFAPGGEGEELLELPLSHIKDVRLRPKLSYVSTVLFVPRFLALTPDVNFLWIDRAYEVQEKVLALIAREAAK